ncbi:MAG: 16S rRNA (cytosine(1402)-N(4))-methyltransferase RsmH [Holosporales bacterium]|jgi:16S rRNA (cytosine1402-N4)-methyltransferase|nr:16S rRNA (cytosine(1402)-N(4))-methyltransferase RsmH [Holosporales bacterium]
MSTLSERESRGDQAELEATSTGSGTKHSEFAPTNVVNGRDCADNAEPTAPTGHTPVLLQEMLHNLTPQPGSVYVDATFGGGGYTEAILEAADTRVIAIDCDWEAQTRAKALAKRYPSRIEFFLSKFSEIGTIMRGRRFDGIVFDFGLSSFQLDSAERGFSFRYDGPLDMRMGKTPLTASSVVNTYKENDIYQILKYYGEERFAKKISRAIVQGRPIDSTLKLADIIRSVVPRTTAIDPCTKTFQALRIFVNDELKEIEVALNKVVDLTGESKIKQVCVVTVAFHSLEDRIIKNWVQRNSTPGPRGVFIEEKIRKVVRPSKSEIERNPRSRSARLRAVLVKNGGLE